MNDLRIRFDLHNEKLMEGDFVMSFTGELLATGMYVGYRQYMLIEQTKERIFPTAAAAYVALFQDYFE